MATLRSKRHERSTVDVDNDAGQECSRIRREKCDDIGDVTRRAEPSDRRFRDVALERARAVRQR